MNTTYTKTGDEGYTSLIGGKRVPKYDDRVETYGTVDELSAFVGVLHDQEDIPDETRQFLGQIQSHLFTMEAHFAVDEETEIRKAMPQLGIDEVNILEQQIDKMNEQLPELKTFVIPGGNLKASYAHVCRTICRRAERQGWRLATMHEVNTTDLKYLNRLSDYFFVLSRYFDFLEKSNEIHWKSV